MKMKFCAACAAEKNLQHHHVIPRVRGGSDEETNLITLCESCHKIMHNLRKKNHLDHNELVALGVKKAKEQLEMESIWKGNWQETMTSVEYLEWQEKQRREKAENAIVFARTEMTLAQQFAESLRPLITEHYDLVYTRSSRFPTLRSTLDMLKEAGKTSRSGGQLTMGTLYKILERLGFPTKQEIKFRLKR